VTVNPLFAERDLEQLRSILDKLYIIVSRILSKSLNALREGHSTDIEDPVLITEELKEIVEYTATLYVARYQPLGKELVEAISAIRVAYDLYRISRYSREIALLMERLEGLKPPEDVIEASNIVESSLSKAYNAYKKESQELSREIAEADDKVDKLYIKRLDSLRGNPTMSVADIGALLILRHLERIMDHEAYIVKARQFSQS